MAGRSTSLTGAGKGSKDTRTPKLAKRRQAAVWGKLKVFAVSEQADKLNKEKADVK